MKYILLFANIFISTLVIFGQQISKVIEFSKSDDYGIEIHEFKDNYLIGVASVCDLPNSNNDCYGYALLNKMGDTILSRINKPNYGEWAMKTPRNNICFHGDTVVFATNYKDINGKTNIRSFKFDALGNLIRSKDYYFPGNDLNYGMIKSKDGYIVHGGLKKTLSEKYIYLLHLNNDLDSIGLVEVGTQCWTEFTALAKNSADDIIIARLYDCFGDIIDIYNFNINKNQNWHFPWLTNFENNFLKYGDDYINIKITKKDDIILISDYNNSNSFSIDSSQFPPLITKISNDGKKLWQKRLFTKYRKNSSHIQLSKNDDILFVGSTEYFTMYAANLYSEGYGSWIALYDSTLNKKWDKFVFDHEHPYGCYLWGGVINKDGSYAFTGVFNDTVANASKLTYNFNTWFLTLDSLGCYNGDCGDVLIFNKPKVANNEIKVFDNQIYPNPTNGILNFINPAIQKMSFIRIFNATGQMVMEANLPIGVPLLQIHLADSLTNGIYFIHQFENGKVTYSSKFILER